MSNGMKISNISVRLTTRELYFVRDKTHIVHIQGIFSNLPQCGMVFEEDTTIDGEFLPGGDFCEECICRSRSFLRTGMSVIDVVPTQKVRPRKRRRTFVSNFLDALKRK